MRALTTVHHLLTISLLITILFDTNELMVAMGALFVTGALAEFPLFAGLLLYRFREGRERLAWWVLLFGLVSYAATRIIQISLHVALCVFFDLGSFSTFTLVWVIGAGFALEGIQMYTFVIYRQILRKVMPRRGRPVAATGRQWPQRRGSRPSWTHSARNAATPTTARLRLRFVRHARMSRPRNRLAPSWLHDFEATCVTDFQTYKSNGG